MLAIIPIPAFSDNYIWLLHDGRNALVVDPGDAQPVLHSLQQLGLRLAAILITHHHADHTGGVAALVERVQCPVYGPAGSPFAGISHPLSDGDHLNLSAPAIGFDIIRVPGHTLDHIAYYGDGSLFCGDTLFACGCGRLFEGTPAQMFDSLGRLAALPGTTRVYCTHEYTLSNQRFALELEPGNAALASRFEADTARRAAGVPTLPTTIAAELATNPFLRSSEPAIAARCSQHAGRPLTTPLDVFTVAREWKNSY